MAVIRDMFHNRCLVAPICAWVLSQILKFILTAVGSGHFVRERLWGSGGMPSAHAATVSALTVSIGMTYGVSSDVFALAFIVSIIVMYDACGVRLEAGRHAKRLNLLSSLLMEEKEPTQSHPFHEQVGHTIPQVFAGAVLGIFVAVLFAHLK